MEHGITIADLMTLINLAQEINKEYDDVNKVHIYIENQKVTYIKEEDKNSFIENGLFNSNNQIQYYQVQSIQYKDGLVSLMKFKKI